MKKIGILFGQERSFPQAFIDRVNSKQVEGIQAEFVTVGEVMQNHTCGYAVIVDRISQDVPFYRAFLKNAAATGTAVINNPFWWSADEKFFNNVLAEQIGVPVPRTVLLPSKDHPTDTTAESFMNLKFPLDWEAMIDYLGGFPLFMKPHAGGGWKSVYKVHNFDELFKAYNETEQLVMMLQQAIEFDSYFRSYCVGGKYVHTMHYEPRNPHHLRYAAKHDVSQAQIDQVNELVIRLNQALGYDLNTVEFAYMGGVPYAIDFCNPAPDADVHSVGAENFEWIVETMATYAIERAQAQVPGQDNLNWGSFVRQAVTPPVKAPSNKKK
jgi:glutathione synthase/RimK-type ligase-like ATP-grasp enzyme